MHGRIKAKNSWPMAHSVKLEVGERDLLHFAIGGVILDPVLIPAMAIARVQHGRISIGNAGQFIEPAPDESAKATEMREEMLVVGSRQVLRKKLLQSWIKLEEVLACAVPRYW